MAEVVYRVSPPVTEEALGALFAAAWGERSRRNFDAILRHSLAYVCAFREGRLVGFVNLAWDGGAHAFLLDVTVHPNFRRHSVGQRLVRCAIEVSRVRGVEWLHVDYEPHLKGFYRRCGFRPTEAGIIRLGNPTPETF